MSSSWLHALRAYATRSSATPASHHARRYLFDQLCATHLRGSPNAELHPDALAILREVRWSLLREGTAADKAELLEHILRQYSQASERAMFTASCSPDGISGSTDTQRKQPASKSRSSRTLPPEDRSPELSNRGIGPGRLLSDAQLSEVSVLQPLLLEQVQCLVEAKVADIPLSARHYRYPLRSPLLATVSPELPLLLLEELTQQSSALSPSIPSSSIDWESRVDCCVGLVAAGHAQEALALCGNDGSAFRAAMQRVVPLRRDGWRYAWALADAVPLSRILDDIAAGGTDSLDWLRGVLDAVDMRHRAAVGARQPASAGGLVSANADLERNDLFEWVDRLRRLILQSSKGLMTGAEGQQQQQQRVWTTALRLVMDTYLSLCPASRWRDAVGVVLELAGALGGTATEGNWGTNAVTIGRLMSMLQAAEQPWVVLLFFYGDSLGLQVASSGPGSDGSTQPPGSGSAARWRVSDKSVQAAVKECVEAARNADRLTVATGSMLKKRDKHHTAIYNHAMVALAATGHYTEATHFYRTLPSQLVNRYTHWSVLQLFLRPARDRRATSALRSSDNYNHCVHALRHLIQMSIAGSQEAGTRPRVRVADDGEHPAASISFTRDQSNLWESMTLWAALRRDSETVGLCALHAPASSRYAHPIALLSAATRRDDGWSVAQEQVRHMCAAPRTTLKELSLATAAVASFFPRWPDGTAVAELPVRAELFDEVARTMARHVGRSQSRMDELLQLLVDYSVSLQRRRRTPMTPQNEEAALDGILVKENILASTMDLARPRAVRSSDNDTEHHGSDHSADDDRAAWRTLVRVMASVAELQGLSAARAAPALVSVGIPAEMAIDLLPT
ncbi:hypothetical protein LSCM1_07719 [Leishmania martiniquensis]|uniref:Uncharacterized protein n=1 Tax=Leishmania martiniquensis TaxID=1580590 RepID=A0A836H757_9TRYP|nr:hypothetical protein LSCM1_07719 [Leishmania martiniquensis]